MRYLFALSTPLVIALTACADDTDNKRGESGGSDDDGDGIENGVDVCPDEAEDFDGFQDEDGCPDVGDNLGTLPTIPTQSGVAYAVHYQTTDLRIYRTDGATPTTENAVDLGAEVAP